MRKSPQKGSIRASIQTPHIGGSTQASLSPQPANARTYIGYFELRTPSLFSRINAKLRSIWESRMYARPITYTGIFCVVLAATALGMCLGAYAARMILGN
jgi:hypothetical protein